MSPEAVLPGDQLRRLRAAVQGEEGVAHLLHALAGVARRRRTAPAARSGSRRSSSRSSHPDDVVDQAAEQPAPGAGHVQVGAAPDQAAGVHQQRARARRSAASVRSGTTSSTWRYSRVSMSTTVIRLPWLLPATTLEYQLVISSRRPSMSSVSLASAEVVMPWGHQRSVATSASFQRNPHSTARPGTGSRAACRLRWSSTPARPTRRPSCCCGLVDVRGVLVGTPQVDARRAVATHPANLGQAQRIGCAHA